MSSASPRALADRFASTSRARRSRAPATTVQRLRRQVWTVLRHELPLSLHLVMLAVSVLPWVFRLDDRWTLWVALDRDLATSDFLFMIVTSVVAFMLGQRDGRNAITEMQAGTVASRRDVVLARMIGMVLAAWLYLSVLVGGMYLLGAMTADWGRPDVRVLAPLYLWPVFVMPLLVALGDRTSQEHIIRPIMWLVIISLVSWFVHVVAWFPFVTSLIEALPWPTPPPDTEPIETYQRPDAIGEAWKWLLAGAGVVAVALLALPARFGPERARSRWLTVAAASLGVVALMLSMGIGLRNGTGYPARAVIGDLTACMSGPAWEACDHPAWEGLIEQHASDITAVLAVIDGAEVLPLQFAFVPVDRLPVGDPPLGTPFPERVVVQTQQYGNSSSESIQRHLVQQMFTVEGWTSGDSTVANVVRAWWLLELGFTPDDTPQLASWLGEHGKLPGGYERPEYPAGYEPPDLRPYIERFAALPEEERITWLDANWDAIRAGELALEDLP